MRTNTKLQLYHLIKIENESFNIMLNRKARKQGKNSGRGMA